MERHPDGCNSLWPACMEEAGVHPGEPLGMAFILSAAFTDYCVITGVFIEKNSIGECPMD